MEKALFAEVYGFKRACVWHNMQERTPCMYSPCQEQTFNQEQTHSMSAIGFGIRFGLVILENPGIDYKIMGAA